MLHKNIKFLTSFHHPSNLHMLLLHYTQKLLQSHPRSLCVSTADVRRTFFFYKNIQEEEEDTRTAWWPKTWAGVKQLHISSMQGNAGASWDFSKTLVVTKGFNVSTQWVQRQRKWRVPVEMSLSSLLWAYTGRLYMHASLTSQLWHSLYSGSLANKQTEHNPTIMIV